MIYCIICAFYCFKWPLIFFTLHWKELRHDIICTVWGRDPEENLLWEPTGNKAKALWNINPYRSETEIDNMCKKLETVSNFKHFRRKNHRFWLPISIKKRSIQTFRHMQSAALRIDTTNLRARHSAVAVQGSGQIGVGSCCDSSWACLRYVPVPPRNRGKCR